MITLKEFLQKKKINFEKDAQAVRWVRSLQPTSLVKIGQTFLISETEMNQLLKRDINKRQETRKKQIKNAETNFQQKVKSKPTKKPPLPPVT